MTKIKGKISFYTAGWQQNNLPCEITADQDLDGIQGPPGKEGKKGDPFTYEDLTEAQKAEIAQPATAQAAIAVQQLEAIHTAIDNLDPSQSTSDAIVAEAATRASKDAELETNLNALGPKINKMEPRVTPIYKADASPNYEQYIQEAYVVDLPEGDIVLKMYAWLGNPYCYMYATGSGIICRTDLLDNVKNGDVVPVKVFATDNTDWPRGKIIGYVVFKDIDGFKSAQSSSAEASLAKRDVVTNIAFSPTINTFLQKADIEGLSTDVANLSTGVNNLAESVSEMKVLQRFSNMNDAVCSWQNATSTFSGWGYTLCNGNGLTIKGVKIKVKNRDSNPTTKVVFGFYKEKHGSANLLVSKTIDVNIAVGTESYVECVLDIPIKYNGNVYLLYACDTKITRYGVNNPSPSVYPFVPADNTSYGKCTYKVGGDTNIGVIGSSSAVISAWTEITVESNIDEAYIRSVVQDEIGGLEAETMLIGVPDQIHAIVGDTLQLYYDAIFRCVDVTKYDVNVICDIGAQYPRYFEVTPIASQAGNHTITFKIKDNNNNLIAEKSSTLVVYSAGTSPSNAINVLCVGASATAPGDWASELKRRLTQSGGTPVGSNFSNINFVGRMPVTKNGITVNLEATGGYSFPSYTSTSTMRYRFNVTAENEPIIGVGDVYSNNGNQYTIVEINITAGQGGYFSCEGNGNPQTSGTLTKVSGTGDSTITFSSTSRSGNPFAYNGAINIQQYAEDYCNGQIDIIYTELFGNGTTAYTDDLSTRLSQMRTFIDNILAVFPNCKFCIGLFWNPDVRGGMGVNYRPNDNWSLGYGIKYTNMALCNALQKYITDENLSNKVFICNWLNEFDTLNDMRQTTKKVNPRSSVTEIFGVNGVHPSEVGYNQMADTAWRLFVAKFCR